MIIETYLFPELFALNNIVVCEVKRVVLIVTEQHKDGNYTYFFSLLFIKWIWNSEDDMSIALKDT